MRGSKFGGGALTTFCKTQPHPYPSRRKPMPSKPTLPPPLRREDGTPTATQNQLGGPTADSSALASWHCLTWARQ
jgi:hypothetical protein